MPTKELHLEAVLVFEVPDNVDLVEAAEAILSEVEMPIRLDCLPGGRVEGVSIEHRSMQDSEDDTDYKERSLTHWRVWNLLQEPKPPVDSAEPLEQPDLL